MVGDDVSYQANYRFYTDDWDVNSHTIENDIYYAMNDDLTLGVGLRYYTQTEASFYNEKKNFFKNEKEASSDERLSSFNALTYKASVDYKFNDNISYNLGAEFYSQSTGLDATMITTGLKYKF
jgi:long-subunit fatty acid transport protein